MSPRFPARQPGFTLFEVLVALAIVAVALLAAMRAAAQATENVGDLRNRVLAEWVARDLLSEQRARGDWPATGIARGTATQAGIEFSWRGEITGTPNAAFRRIDIRVFPDASESRSLARLTGFLVNPAVSNPR